jgi:NAD(P)-dependent dehydrogenase (short-subunit alcohol dehydrogenase family)
MITDFHNKTAFITGGAGGIGLAMGRAFGRAGMNVVLADIDETAVRAASDELAASQIRAEAVVCDVGDRASVQEAAQKAIAAFGKVHVVCNNAGVGVGGELGHTPASHWDWILDVNIKGVVFGVEVFLPLILSHGEGGHFINTASMAGMLSPPGLEPYSATKFAVVALSEGWAQQLAPMGIGMSVLCPGFVRTRIHESARARQDRYGGAADSEGLNPASAAAVLAGIDADVVGERVREAIQGGEFYIFTHPNMRPAVQMRFAGIMAGFDAADRSEALKAVKEWPPITTLSPGGGG